MKLRTTALITAFLAVSCKGAPRGQSEAPTNLSDLAPIRLVREYVSRDANGERIRRNTWFFNVVTWSEEPGWDSYIVVRGFQISPVRADSSTARVTVTYRVAGYVRTTGRTTAAFVDDTATETRIFTVALTDNGWRIVAPQID